jgi:hypothetical protein
LYFEFFSYLDSFCSQTVCILWFSSYIFISAVVILDLSCSFSVHVLLLCRRAGIASVLFIHNLVSFWTLKVLELDLWSFNSSKMSSFCFCVTCNSLPFIK